MSSIVNQYLALDEESAAKIERFYGKLIGVELEVINTNFYVLFHRDRIEILEEFAGDADVIIRGAPFSMLALVKGHTDVTAADIAITGDAALAGQVNVLIQKIDIDWEEHISRLTGDAVARQMGNLARKIATFISRTQSRTNDNIADYLRDETNQLPHEWEVEEFGNEVDDLRDRVEALKLRITKR